MGSGGTRKAGGGGSRKKDWWPDWTGETVLIAASGPSQREADVHAAKGRCKVIAINNEWEIAPWADVLYACDLQWWQEYRPDFPGLKVMGEKEFPGVHTFRVSGPAMRWDGGFLGGAGNSGAQALNLAVLWGARRVVLTGYDYKHPNQHRHGQHPPGLTRHGQINLDHWIKDMNRNAPDVLARAEVINATRDTALECFPRMSLEEALG